VLKISGRVLNWETPQALKQVHLKVSSVAGPVTLTPGPSLFERGEEETVEHLKRQLKAREALIGQLTFELKKQNSSYGG
jgi:hypothetical protein